MRKRTFGSIALAIALVFSTTAQIAPANAADANINSLIKRLNSKSKIWQLNPSSGTRLAIMSHQRLGLYQEPTAVIDCNLRWSGTWLFVYKSVNQGYKAASSEYFYRDGGYDAEIMIDPRTNYVVLVHTSMGGTQQCLNSAYKVLSYISD